MPGPSNFSQWSSSVNYWHRQIGKRSYSFRSSLWSRLSLLRISVYSLFYNDHVDSGYVIDTLMEPMFWFVDNFTKSLGPIFVVLVIATLFIYVSIAWIVGFPFWYERSKIVLILGIFIGNWILVNASFNYYMALTTPPGSPPERSVIEAAVSICKKCISPKPARAHHCSVCNRCILKMDHHCPWLNACVGHFNHRYFFLFCCYVWLGTIFIGLFGIWVAYEEYFGDDRFYKNDTSTAAINSTIEENGQPIRTWWQSFRHGCIVFELLATAGIFMAIGALTSWHIKLITDGETCVETYINQKERKRLTKLGYHFVNPYDFGPLNNWRNFLGFNQGKTWIHILLPSVSPPIGDGLTWIMSSTGAKQIDTLHGHSHLDVQPGYSQL